MWLCNWDCESAAMLSRMRPKTCSPVLDFANDAPSSNRLSQSSVFSYFARCLNSAIADNRVKYAELLAHLFDDLLGISFRLRIDHHLKHFGWSYGLNAWIPPFYHEVTVYCFTFWVIDVWLVFYYHMNNKLCQQVFGCRLGLNMLKCWISWNFRTLCKGTRNLSSENLRFMHRRKCIKTR